MSTACATGGGGGGLHKTSNTPCAIPRMSKFEGGRSSSKHNGSKCMLYDPGTLGR